MRELSGRHAIVTGASRGIGLEVATCLAREGVSVALNARSRGRLDAAAETVATFGTNVVAVAGDLASAAVRQAIVEQSLMAFGSIDILINNAGMEPITAFDTQADAEIVRAIGLNFTATVLLTRQVLPHMLERRKGHIVTVSSVAGLIGQPYTATYSGTKAALVKWSEALRRELHGRGVGVCVVCPGFVEGAGLVGELARATAVRPPRAATVTSAQVARAVLQAIGTDVGQVVVQPGPVRTFLAVDALLPSVGDAISRIIGAEAYLRKTADWNGRRPA